MKIGDLVREAETDEEWQFVGDQVGVIVSSADDEMKMPGCGRFWNVLFGAGIMSFIDDDLELAA